MKNIIYSSVIYKYYLENIYFIQKYLFIYKISWVKLLQRQHGKSTSNHVSSIKSMFRVVASLVVFVSIIRNISGHLWHDRNSPSYRYRVEFTRVLFIPCELFLSMVR